MNNSLEGHSECNNVNEKVCFIFRYSIKRRTLTEKFDSHTMKSRLTIIIETSVVKVLLCHMSQNFLRMSITCATPGSKCKAGKKRVKQTKRRKIKLHVQTNNLDESESRAHSNAHVTCYCCRFDGSWMNDNAKNFHCRSCVGGWKTLCSWTICVFTARKWSVTLFLLPNMIRLQPAKRERI